MLASNLASLTPCQVRIDLQDSHDSSRRTNTTLRLDHNITGCHDSKLASGNGYWASLGHVSAIVLYLVMLPLINLCLAFNWSRTQQKVITYKVKIESFR